MPKDCREQRYPRVDIDMLLVPIDQLANRVAVSQVVDPGACSFSAPRQTGLREGYVALSEFLFSLVPRVETNTEGATGS